MLAFFASDLHGDLGRYARLFEAIAVERPGAVFLGGDLLPSVFRPLGGHRSDFIGEFLAGHLRRMRERLGDDYPSIFAIFGNDDPRSDERDALALDGEGLWQYAQGRRLTWGGRPVFGYGFVPPTPFRLKDWERFDVSRYVDPGCVSPEEGFRTVAVEAHEVRHATIQRDLEQLAGGQDVSGAIFLFHAPPFETRLDRAALDGQIIDCVPVGVHVGSIAVRRFIESRQPLVTLHGHIHESARLTGTWQERLGATYMFSAAHDGPELALVRFDPEAPGQASRELVPV